MQRHGLPSSWLWGHKYHLAARWSDKFAVATTTGASTLLEAWAKYTKKNIENTLLLNGVGVSLVLYTVLICT